MHLCGFLVFAQFGATGHLSTSQIRKQNARAVTCGLIPGLQIEDMGISTAYMDLDSGRQISPKSEDSDLAEFVLTGT